MMVQQPEVLEIQKKPTLEAEFVTTTAQIKHHDTIGKDFLPLDKDSILSPSSQRIDSPTLKKINDCFNDPSPAAQANNYTLPMNGGHRETLNTSNLP